MSTKFPINWEELYERQKGLCGLCQEPLSNKRGPHGNLSRKDTNIDHIRPKSKGGQSTKDNLQLTHSKCNTIKGDGSYAVVCCIKCRSIISDVKFNKHKEIHNWTLPETK